MDKKMKSVSSLNRRRFLSSTAATGALALATPSIMRRSAYGQSPNRIVFISEESSDKAQAVYDRINADFERETGISVTMEYPGFTNIAQRVATLIAAGTPAEIVWYGAGQAMDVALQGQLADVGDLVTKHNIPDNLRMVVDGADRSVPTSQQFFYGWYRQDLYEAQGLSAYETWEDYLSVVKALNSPPDIYGNVIPSVEQGASHLLLETMFQKNDVHWFAYDESDGKYRVALDEGENLTRAVEALEFLHEAHQYSPEASNYNWAELMSEYYTGNVANSYYVGSRLLDQTVANNPDLAPHTMPVALPRRLTESYYLSVQGFHINKDSNIDGAKQYVSFFLEHPAYVDWLHSVPLHIIPAQQSMLRSEAYQDNEFIQRRMDVLEFLDSIWGKGTPPYYWDGPKLNPLVGLYQNANRGGRMLAERNIRGTDSETVVRETAEWIRNKVAEEEARRQ